MKFSPIYYLILLLQFSCSHVEKKDCKKINWKNQGEIDALSGKRSSMAKECIKFGFKDIEKEYEEGFTAGSKKSCTFKNNFDLGLAGKPENLACSQLDPVFKDAYETGLNEYKVQKKRENQEKEKLALMKKERQEMREKIKKTYSKSKQCDWDGDCVRTYSCLKNNCEVTNKYCRFDSECDVKGKCSEVTYKTKTYKESVSIKLCQFE